ncbi:MAG: hypothetical protein D6706_10800 [Chloroflexi bacterium]|nr:MAG: hypothetical protein D6706_10800 [Chloroflexota bacterium]
MKSLLKNLSLALFSLLFTLAMLEIAARVFHLGTGGFWEPHPLYGWRNIPNADGWESCYGECAVHVKINSRGLRDEEIPYEKAEGEKRILLLGDSMTAGMQVPLADTFGEQLEDYLNQWDNENQWTVVNGAVNGFGTDNELIFYREEGIKYQPDIVLVGVYLANDIYNNSRVLELRTGGQSHKPYFTLTETGELELHNFPAENTDTLFIRIGSFLKKHFQLPRFVAQTLNLRGEVPGWLRPIVSLFSGSRGVQQTKTASEDEGENEQAKASAGRTKEPTICDAEYAPEIEEAWNITKAIIRQMRTEVEANGAQLAIVLIPTAAQVIPPKDGVSWYCERPNQELTAFLDEEGIPYLDMLQPFRDHMLAGGDTLYYKRDFHMNEGGHHLAGKLIADFVAESLLIPSGIQIGQQN